VCVCVCTEIYFVSLLVVVKSKNLTGPLLSRLYVTCVVAIPQKSFLLMPFHLIRLNSQLYYYSKTFMLANNPSSYQETVQGEETLYSFGIFGSGVGDKGVEPWKLLNFLTWTHLRCIWRHYPLSSRREDLSCHNT
jgi:hypothetical protein